MSCAVCGAMETSHLRRELLRFADKPFEVGAPADNFLYRCKLLTFSL